ncbi:MAG: prenyltransferase [Candidatus Heimdallarchaeum aukensis]|uniref:Prenyltransferase n=1 Tax=Candidatus Heimdallarchaeum aukensis TaxID=2876573 RepID=A0A9Y1BP25_9ARCH|nr:MAG: prenyltransferase [Candidatus Heimdallarchaeum aukensis]
MLTFLSRFKLWFIVSRPFSFTLSLFTVTLGLIISWYEISYINWFLAFLTFIGIFLLHLGANLVSEYVDFKKGIDVSNIHTQGRILVRGLLIPKHVFWVGFFSFLVGIFVGLYIFYLTRIFWVLYLGLLGVILAFFYGLAPFELKYRGLGEFAIFFTFGIGITLGTFIVQSGFFSWLSLFLSLPQALLILAVLQGNNYRDLEIDAGFGMKSLSILFGKRFAFFEYVLLVVLPFILVFVYLLLDIVDYWSLLTFLTFPLALKNIIALKNENEKIFSIIDVHTAQLHMIFTLLFIISLLPSFVF